MDARFSRGEPACLRLPINGLSTGGTIGEAVRVDIIRDGQPMQLIVPRGPLEATLQSGGTVRFVRPLD
jgi:hypothetical protein